MTPNSAADQPLHYEAYLVKMWRSDADALWRASVTHVRTGQLTYFDSLERLYVFFHEHADEASMLPASSVN